jgi:NAD(P)-dependent dehydrogenase (short-subunit alcohol dehydrogenase family)
VSVVLITGCSSGFGLAIAQAFAKRGDQVVATAWDPSRATGLLADPNSLPDIVYRLDVTDQGSINDAVRQTLAEYGRIDVLVNNAGVGLVGALEVIDELQLRQIFDTNVFGAVAVTRAVLPSMREQGTGRIVFMNAIGLTQRIQRGPADLSPVVNAVVEAATSADPKPRYPVAPHLSDVLEPALAALEALHQREISLSRPA